MAFASADAFIWPPSAAQVVFPVGDDVRLPLVPKVAGGVGDWVGWLTTVAWVLPEPLVEVLVLVEMGVA